MRVRVRGGLLAGGRSLRMGRDKASIVVDPATGETLGGRALAALRAVSDDVVVLGHGRGIALEVPRLQDALPDAGPIGGILALLHTDDADLFIVAAVDMPDMDAAGLLLLVQALMAAPPAHAAVFMERDRPKRSPLPLALRRTARDGVGRAVARGERSLMEILDGLSLVSVAYPSAPVLENLNTSEDLQRWAGRRRRE